jgi:hypothetical protein
VRRASCRRTRGNEASHVVAMSLVFAPRLLASKATFSCVLHTYHTRLRLFSFLLVLNNPPPTYVERHSLRRVSTVNMTAPPGYTPNLLSTQNLHLSWPYK